MTAGAFAALLVSASAANAADVWHTFDTDNISRSVSSGRAYTDDATFKWQKDEDWYEDYRAVWSAKLRVNGANGSCARLRIITIGDDGAISKRFPAAGTTDYGYYQACRADGRGYANLSGSDLRRSNFSDTTNNFRRADISVCYAPGSNQPNTECYNFTIHPGD